VKKRILQLTGSFHNGGTERQAVVTAVGMRDAGEFDITLATLDLAGPLLTEVTRAGFESIPEFSLTSFFNARFVAQVRRCAAFLREKQIDLIHTHDFYTNVFGMAAATLARTRVKLVSKRETGNMRSKKQDLAERTAFSLSDHILANSEAVKSFLTGRGIPAEKVDVIYNGLDLTSFTSGGDVKQRLGISPNARVITLVANLRHRVKNVPMFLRVARTVADRIGDAVFVIAGEGELESELRSLAGDFGIADKTYFIGRCDNVPALLNSSYACVLTSTAEGFSNSIIEYMAAGKPVVATNVGGAAEAVVDGKTGYLVASDDDASLAARLIELLSDEQTAVQFGKEGRRTVDERFSRHAQLENTSALYRRLLEN
jgi:L-malate glycosyltransferase